MKVFQIWCDDMKYGLEKVLAYAKENPTLQTKIEEIPYEGYEVVFEESKVDYPS